MKKKIIMALLVMATVVGMGFAQTMCYNAKNNIRYSINGTSVTFFNRNNEKTITVSYKLTGDDDGECKEDTIQISPADSEKASVNFKIKSVTITEAGYCGIK
ncbi:MAG: hypothetical protein ACTTKX_07260 [Treponema sp.]